MSKKRYFLILFSGLTNDNVLRTGKIEYATNTGKHINEKFIIHKIESQFGLTQVFVRDVREMGEQDFIEWIEGRDNTPPELPDENDSDEGFL